MAINNQEQDLIAFLNQMPPDMKQTAIKNIEALRGMTISEYKAQQIKAAELFLADVQAHPDNYTVASFDKKHRELIGGFAIDKDLNRHFGLTKWFISQRNLVVTTGDGGLETLHANQTFEEFMQTKTPLKGK